MHISKTLLPVLDMLKYGGCYDYVILLESKFLVFDVSYLDVNIRPRTPGSIFRVVDELRTYLYAFAGQSVLRTLDYKPSRSNSHLKNSSAGVNRMSFPNVSEFSLKLLLSLCGVNTTD